MTQWVFVCLWHIGIVCIILDFDQDQTQMSKKATTLSSLILISSFKNCHSHYGIFAFFSLHVPLYAKMVWIQTKVCFSQNIFPHSGRISSIFLSVHFYQSFKPEMPCVLHFMLGHYCFFTKKTWYVMSSQFWKKKKNLRNKEEFYHFILFMSNFNMSEIRIVWNEEKQGICTFNCVSEIHTYHSIVDQIESNIAAGKWQNQLLSGNCAVAKEKIKQNRMHPVS